MIAKKERALNALITSSTLAQAAEKAGLSVRTLYRYFNEDAEFKRRYDDAKGRLVNEATDMLRKSFIPAVERLRKLVQNDGINPAVQIQAARAVLDYGLKLMETQDIIQRLEALEAATESTKEGSSIWKV